MEDRQIELCKECNKPESDIGHEEHPHNGSVIDHYFQKSGKFLPLSEIARRQSVAYTKCEISRLRRRRVDDEKQLKRLGRELKALRRS